MSTRKRKPHRPSPAFSPLCCAVIAGPMLIAGCSDTFESCDDTRTCAVAGADGSGSGGGGNGGAAAGGRGSEGSGSAGDDAAAAAGGFWLDGEAGSSLGGAQVAGAAGDQGGDEQGGAAGSSAGGAGGEGASVASECIPGIEATCAARYASKGECGARPITCTDEGRWPAAADACGPARRDCTSPKDNDCDGRSDDLLDGACKCAVGATQDCDTHPRTDGIGLCKAGHRTCELSATKEGSQWGSCRGSVVPVPERCGNLLDDDCNKRVDENCSCTEGDSFPCGACGMGAQTCTGGIWGLCHDNDLECNTCTLGCTRFAPVSQVGRCCFCNDVQGTYAVSAFSASYYVCK